MMTGGENKIRDISPAKPIGLPDDWRFNLDQHVIVTNLVIQPAYCPASTLSSEVSPNLASRSQEEVWLRLHVLSLEWRVST